MPKKRAVVVLGMHRSGTSVVSRCINMLGFDLGENLMAPRKDNPKGFWENKEIVRYNEELMAGSRVRWDSLELDLSLILKKGLTKKSQTAALRVLKREFSSSRIVIKDPRISRLYPVWQKALWDANFSIVPVIVLRDPGSVARSLAKRDLMPLYRGLLLWLIYTLEAVQYAKRSPIFINYDKVVRDPKVGLAPLERLNPKEDMSWVKEHILPALVTTYAESEAVAESTKLYDEVSLSKAHSASLEIERKNYNRQIKLFKSALTAKDKYVISMQAVLQEKEAMLVKVKQHLTEKNKANKEYVKSLSASLEDKTADLVASEKYIAERTKVSDEYMTSLRSSLEEKENYISELSSSLQEKENYISELSSSLQEKENYINHLESTKLVGIAKKIHGIKRERDA